MLYRNQYRPCLALSLCLILPISACSSKPPEPELGHAFVVGPQIEDNQGSTIQQFTLVVWSNDNKSDKRQANSERKQLDRGPGGDRQRPPGGRGGDKGGRGDTAPSMVDSARADSGPAPGQLSLPDDQIMQMLEQELDARHWCEKGYQINDRRPTARGIALEGQCPVDG